MDSWSRPSKSQATPAPYYLLPGGENTPYCHSCGRVISQRRTNAAASKNNEAKYCSSRCRSHKPGKLDREIENLFVRFLTGELKLDTRADGAADGEKQANKAKKGRKTKGDRRILVPCSAVEEMMFGRRSEEGFSDKSRTPEPETEHQEDAEVEYPGALAGDAAEEAAPSEGKAYVDGHALARMSIRSGTRIRPAQDLSEVNGSVGGEKGWAERVEESEEMLEKRRQGLRRVKEKEMVKCAARRGVVFGLLGAEGGQSDQVRRMCEAVMNGKVVEPSFAKGDWSIRLRE